MVNSAVSAVKPGRVESIDALRGFDMFWIIGGTEIVQGWAKGSGSRLLNSLMPQLGHVPWEGFHFYDLIMPLFLFIVGAAMPFSFKKRLGRGDSRKEIYIHVIKRVIILFVLGMMTQGNLFQYSWSQLHIFIGTLPAIGAGYLVASLLMLNFRLRAQICATSVLLLLYWAIMTLVPVPGRAAGDLTPTGNLGFWFDRFIMHGFLPADRTYTQLLNIMTFGSTVMLGVFAGYLLQSGRTKKEKVLLLLGMGIGTMMLGLFWSLWFPIIKHIWSSSFVLFAGGLSYLLLALFYLVIDVLGYRKWAFGFTIIGMNSIAVYMATHLYDFRNIGAIFTRGLARWTGPWQDCVHALGGFVVVWLILYWMYRKRTFISI
jgi:predicted acyltransferase